MDRQEVYINHGAFTEYATNNLSPAMSLCGCIGNPALLGDSASQAVVRRGSAKILLRDIPFAPP